jgi:hypothetical protein
MRIAVPLTVLAALACCPAPSPAHARARVFVASYGNDANPCTFLSPCKTFQNAVNVVDPGGEVTAIDSAGFGPVDINKAVTITSPPGVEAGIAASPAGNAITISAPGAAVSLRGLTLEGGATGAYNGIAFSSGAKLDIIDCAVRDYQVAGISLGPATGAQITIAGSYISNNNTGIALSSGSGTVYLAIEHAVMTDNGLAINALAGSGDMDLTIANSSISHSNNYGLQTGSLGSGNVSAKLINVVFEDTQGNAIYAQAGSSVTISQVNDGHDAGGLAINGGTITSDGTNHYPSVSGGSVGSYALK